jgi:hypothetical protein
MPAPRDGPTRVLADFSLAGNTDARDPKQDPALPSGASQPQNQRSHGTWARCVAMRLGTKETQGYLGSNVPDDVPDDGKFHRTALGDA